jgi:hypothetical protein
MNRKRKEMGFEGRLAPGFRGFRRFRGFKGGGIAFGDEVL